MSVEWYVIKVQPGRELYVANALRPPNKDLTVIEYLDNAEADIYVPRCEPTMLDIHKTVVDPDDGTVTQIVIGTQRVSGIILPGYVFVRTAMTRLANSAIMGTPYVDTIIPDAWDPMSLAVHEMDALRKSCDALIRQSQTAPDLSAMIGQTFRIESGSYADCSGPCWGFDNKGNPKITLPIMGRLLPVPIPVEHLNMTPIKMAQTQDHVVKTKMLGYREKQQVIS